MSQTASRSQHGAPLEPGDLAALRRAVDAAGSVVRASRALGVPRHTVERALGGLPVRTGTAIMIRGAVVATQPNTGRAALDAEGEESDS
jgi:hypothetical protein